MRRKPHRFTECALGCAALVLTLVLGGCHGADEQPIADASAAPGACAVETAVVRDVETGAPVDDAHRWCANGRAMVEAPGYVAAGMPLDATPQVVTLHRRTEATEIADVGGQLSGRGWQVIVPPDAVDEPTELAITPTSGAVDGIGDAVPVLDVSRVSLYAPATIALDMPWLAGEDWEFAFYDPFTGSETALSAQHTGTEWHIEFTASNGDWLIGRTGAQDQMSRVLQWVTDSGLAGSLDDLCEPFDDRGQAGLVRDALAATLPQAARSATGWHSEAATAWSMYLAGIGGTLELDGAVLSTLRDSPEVKDAHTTMMDKLVASLAAQRDAMVGPPSRSFTIDEYFDSPGGVAVEVNFADKFTLPGNLVGGESGSDFGADRRVLSGTFALDFTYNEWAEVATATYSDAFLLEIQDAVDFCPGGAGGSDEQALTIVLSRLEASGIAADVKITALVDLHPGERDVTEDFQQDVVLDAGCPFISEPTGYSFISAKDPCAGIKHDGPWPVTEDVSTIIETDLIRLGYVTGFGDFFQGFPEATKQNAGEGYQDDFGCTVVSPDIYSATAAVGGVQVVSYYATPRASDGCGPEVVEVPLGGTFVVLGDDSFLEVDETFDYPRGHNLPAAVHQRTVELVGAMTSN